MRVPDARSLCGSFFLEVIPLAPLVSARTPPIALTGFLSGLALSDLLAVTQG